MHSMPPIKIPNAVMRMAENHRTQKYFLPVSFFTLHLRRVYRSSILQKSMCSEPVQAPVRPPAIKIIALRDGPDILLFGVLYVVFHYSHHNSAQADVLEFAHLWAGRGGCQSKNSISLPGTHATRIREKIGNRVCTSVAIASLTFPREAPKAHAVSTRWTRCVCQAFSSY